MTELQTPDGKALHLYPPPSADFDPFAASERDLRRHGLPFRPDPHKDPGMAALWERKANRYRHFAHIQPQPDTTTAAKKVLTLSGLGPDPLESCGYQFFNTNAPFTILSITWTVPDLQYSASPLGVDNFHTFVGLGFLDVHVEMTVDASQNVVCQLWAQDVGNVNMAVRPGDVISATLCLDTQPPGRAYYYFANETTAQTINFIVDTGFPPAVTVNAGITRPSFDNGVPFPPLARFGAVYFDEINAYTTSGSRSLTAGDAITMVSQNGQVLASPVRLTDFTFKAVFEAAG
jgi:hypothetical protein